MNPILEEQQLIVIPDFILVDKAEALAIEFEDYCIQNNVGTPWEGLNASEMRNWPPFENLLIEMIPKVSEIAGVELLPSFARSRVYHRGSALFHHKDRSACEFGVTCHLRGDTDWPLFFQRDQDEEPKSITLSQGQAILYLGSRITHWRDLFEGDNYTQVFLFYVDKNGPHADEAYDALNPQR